MAKLTGQSGALAIRIVTWAKDLRFWYGLAAVIIFTAVIILLIMLTRMNLAKADVDALLIEKLGGDTTALSASRDAFSLPAPNLTTDRAFAKSVLVERYRRLCAESLSSAGERFLRRPQ